MANTPNTIHVKVDMDTAEVRAAILRAKAEAWEEGFTRGYQECDAHTGLNPYGVGRGLDARDCDVPNPYRAA